MDAMNAESIRCCGMEFDIDREAGKLRQVETLSQPGRQTATVTSTWPLERLGDPPMCPCCGKASEHHG